MKSRLLSTAAALFLLLGLVSTNVFAQISSSSNVNFYIRSYTAGDALTNSLWRDNNGGNVVDTVGRKYEVKAQWETASQSLTSVNYTVTFPKGTVLETNAADSIYLSIYDGFSTGGTPQTVKIDASKIAVSGNPLASYSETATPAITVTSDIQFSSDKTLQLLFYKGLYFGKKLENVNDAPNGKMQFKLALSSQAGTTFIDSTSLRVAPDWVDGVAFNTAITAYIDASTNPFPSADTVYFVDKFGNPIGDFYSSVADSLVISVPSGAGFFVVDSVNRATNTGTATAASAPDPYTDGNVKYATAADSTKIVILYDNTLIETATGGDDKIFHKTTTTRGTGSYDVIYFPLGMRSAGNVTEGGIGLAFNGANTQDSTTFTFTVHSASRVKTTSILGVAGTGVRTVTRKRLPDASTKAIGSISVSFTPGTAGVKKTYVGDYLGGSTSSSIAITVKNIFGDEFSNGTVMSSGTDTIMYKFLYKRFASDTTEVTANTGYLQNGKTVSSKHTMPAATLNYTGGSGDVIDGYVIKAAIGASSVATISGTAANSLPIYYGMASHPAGDSVVVVVYAKNDPTKNDSFRIKVEPGAPVAFDTDTLLAKLADINVVAGKSIAGALPLFALDTAYNRVSDLDFTVAGGLIDAFLEADSVSSLRSGQTKFPLINALIDERDPIGFNSTTVTDSIKFLGINYTDRNAEVGITGAGTNFDSLRADSSFITGFTKRRQDSSIVNLGSVAYSDSVTGSQLDMVLGLKGLNRKLSLKWNPAKRSSTMPAAWDPAARTQQIALINLEDTTLVDSASTITIQSPTTHKAGQAVDTMIVEFKLPQGNTIGPNEADSLIYVRFANMAGDPGLPVGLTADKVQVSSDSGANWTNSFGVSAITSTDEDSVWIATPLTMNASTGTKTVRVRFLNFVNPTRANVDSTKMYSVIVKTEATPIKAESQTAMDAKVVAGAAARLVVITPMDTLKRTYPRWLSDVVEVSNEVALTAGTASAAWKILQADAYGNILNKESGLVRGDTKKLVFVGMDTTSTGNATVVSQTYDNVATSSSGKLTGTGANNMYDTLTVKIDSAYTSGNKAVFADSVMVTLYNNNAATAYYLKVMDTTMAVRDSVLVNVAGGAVSSITLDPATKMNGQREANLPTLSVTAKDVYGNPKSGVAITLARTFGADGAFVDTNGVAITSGVDTVSVVTKSTGIATAIYKTGAVTDSVAIMASASGVTSKYFTAKLTVADSAMHFVVSQPADSLEPDLALAGTIKAEVTDGNSVSKVWVNVWRSLLTRNGSNVFEASEPTAIMMAASATGASDVVNVSLAIGDTADVDTAVVIRYQLVGVDGTSDTTWSDTMMYVVAPNRGKRVMTNTEVSVADVMRLVYLIAIDEIVPTDIDYLGLDLDADGTFNTPDLLAELAIWKGTGTLLAGVSNPENATAKAELSYEATDKATANLALSLDNSDNLNVAVFKIKYDTEKFVFGEAKATDRIHGVTVVSDANENDGIYTIVLINSEGGQIVKGSGAILNIEVSAVGEKFDGVGEISLQSAGFEEGVSAEISREVLAPKALLPKAFAMSQNYPNPFNPSTTIAYDIPEGDNVQVQLNVYNMRGQLVRTLVDESKSEGSYQIQWDGADNYGRRVSSGVYFYRIKAGEFSKTRKMVILK